MHMNDCKKIKAFILRKLVRRKNWMHKHTNIHNLPKGLPNRLRQNKKLLKKVIESLLKQGFLLSKPTLYGLEVSLNTKKKKEIENLIDDVFY